MNIFQNVKQVGKRKPTVGVCEMNISQSCDSLRKVIVCVVNDMIENYNARVADQTGAKPLDESDVADMSEVGKIAFGINYGGKYADGDKGVETAIVGFEDGLYRVFLGKNELTQLDEKIQLKDGDTLTFIRLVMLSGRLW